MHKSPITQLGQGLEKVSSHSLGKLFQFAERKKTKEEQAIELIKKSILLNYSSDVAKMTEELQCRKLPKPEDNVVKIKLTGKNSNYKCQFFSALNHSGLTGEKDIREFLENINWDPCCLTNEMKRFLDNNEGNQINGFSVGIELVKGFLKSLSGAYGKELVVLLTDEDTLQVSVVNYEGGGLALSLPAGASVTQSIIHGKCDTVKDYLGHFTSVSLTGMTKNYGVNKGIFTGNIEERSERTGCNSSSLVTGATTSILHIMDVNYHLKGKTYEISGPRIKKMVTLLKKASQRIKDGKDKFRKGKTVISKEYDNGTCDNNIVTQFFKHIKDIEF